MKYAVQALALITLFVTTSIIADDSKPIPTLQTFKSKPARDAVRRFLDKTSSYESRLKELNDEARTALDGELRTAMAEAIEKSDVLEVNRISTFLTAEPSTASGKNEHRMSEEIERLRKQIAAMPSIAPDSLHGSWVGKWNTTGRVYEATINSEGTIVDWTGTHKLFLAETRHFRRDTEGNVLEIVPFGSYLIALGWDKRDPTTEQPRHVAVLRNANK